MMAWGKTSRDGSVVSSGGVSTGLLHATNVSKARLQKFPNAIRRFMGSYLRTKGWKCQTFGDFLVVRANVEHTSIVSPMEPPSETAIL